ncbi:MAG: hypothetical protein JWP91_655 [Fibrobacteres bacterium]|nr:hypothetical protein [Fibrobacterota bacterium]
MFHLQRRMRRLPLKMALSFLAFLVFSQGLAEGFVLCINPQGGMALELEAQGCAEENTKGMHETAAPLAIHCGTPGNTGCCVDISALDEFPPLPSAVGMTRIPGPFLALLPAPPRRLVPSPSRFQRDLSPHGMSPLGPDPLATIRLTI